jgi:NAD(P)-dependent dehydrogenase (short-subunit alcohol dehydrogenase family)
MKGWVLVTGAAQRIGREIALELARGGWDIIVHYNTSADAAQKTAEEIEKIGRHAVLAEMDLANLVVVEKLIPTLAGEVGAIRGLVNSAAMFLSDVQDADNVQALVNAEAPRILSEAFYRQASAEGDFSIVNILDAYPNTSGFNYYNASKKRLAELTQGMVSRFAPRVRVNGLALGPVLRNPRQSEEHFAKLVAATPMRRAARPEDIARTVRLFMESAGLTGGMLGYA